MSADDETPEDEDETPEMNTQEGRSALAFLRWLKDNDVGVGLCHLHDESSDRAPRGRSELTPDEWAALVEEWERDE